MSDLPNLGPATSAWLAAVGIRTRQDLQRMGLIPACRAMHLMGFPISVMGAYALQAAVLGCPWQALPADERQDIRREFTVKVRGVQAHSTAVAGRRRSGR